MRTSITALIKKFLTDNGMTQVYLAGLLKESPQNLANKLRKRDLNTDYIQRVSIALNHDFFADLSRLLKAELKPVANTRPKNGSGSSDGEVDYTRQEAYIRLLEENIELYRRLDVAK
jgi:hypothetical protein